MTKYECFFKDCDTKIKNNCLDRLSEFNEIETDMNRFEIEMRAISDFGFAPYFFLLKDIIDYSIQEKTIVISDGVTSYSYVAFLYGITGINPINYGYDGRFCFGYKYDKIPAVGVIAPLGFKEKLKRHLLECFDEDEIHFGNNSIFIGITNDNTNSLYEKYNNCIGIGYIEMDINSQLYNILSVEGFVDVRKEIFNSEPINICTNDMKDSLYNEVIHFFGLDYENEIDKEFKDNLYNTIYEKKYIEEQDLIRIIALIRGTGVYAANNNEYKNVLHDKGFYTKDDVYRRALEYCNNDGDAYTSMERVRKGMGKLKDVQELLFGIGFSNSEINTLSKIKFLVSEGACVPLAKIIYYNIEKR